MTSGILVYFMCIFFNIFLLLWWRYCCEWEYNEIKFPTRGHMMLLIIASFIPIWNCVQFSVLCGIYIGVRVVKNLLLKNNKFNRYWFDVDKDK